VSSFKIVSGDFRAVRAPINMAAVTKNRTYGRMLGFWVITQKPLIISEI
jgi:hypothetical protein